MNSIFPNYKWYISIPSLGGAQAHLGLNNIQFIFVQIAICICPNLKFHLSKLKIEFVQIENFICPNCVFVKTSGSPWSWSLFDSLFLTQFFSTLRCFWSRLEKIIYLEI